MPIAAATSIRGRDGAWKHLSWFTGPVASRSNAVITMVFKQFIKSKWNPRKVESAAGTETQQTYAKGRTDYELRPCPGKLLRHFAPSSVLNHPHTVCPALYDTGTKVTSLTFLGTPTT